MNTLVLFFKLEVQEKEAIFIKRYWLEEEVEFLKFAYQNEDFSIDEICKALGRNKCSVIAKASNLKVKRPKYIAPEGYKRCSTCKTILPLNAEFFSRATDKIDGFHCICKSCRKNKKIKRDATVILETKVKRCNLCHIEKPINEFSKNKNIKDGYLNQCKDCRSELYKKAYIRGGY